MKRFCCILLIFLLAMASCQTSTIPQNDQDKDTLSQDKEDTQSEQPSIADPDNSPAPSAKELRARKLAAVGIPSPEEEFRGVWVAATDIIALLSGKNDREAVIALDKLMDDCIAYHLNTVIFHVRVNSDAYYCSTIFKPAVAVQDLLSGGFDILSYAVEAAHKRGLDIHAWANPYRIGSNRENAVCQDYIQYGSYYYYIPTSETAQAYIVSGMQEIVDRYDVDGLQYDDYFYTEGTVSADKPADFETEYEIYRAGGGTLSVADWRREAVNSLIRRTYEVAHSKKECVFGISPAYQVEKNYHQKYADVLLWMEKEGYVDYLMPQIYFGFENQTAPFIPTTQTWMGYKKDPSVRVYIGLALYKTGMKNDSNAGSGNSEWFSCQDIMLRQISYLQENNADGYCFFRYSFFDPNMTRDSGYSKDIAAVEVFNLVKQMG
ncbi:MAG TPA: hypothetical protein DCY74_04780 [Clostridiales bacterium]|nr:hypothetical protein [Clostridiales bacterium]